MCILFLFFFFRSVNNFEQEMLGLNHRGLHVSSGTRYVIFKSQLMYYKVFRYDSDKNLCFISKTNQTPNVLSNQNESTRVHLIRTWSGHLFFFCPDYFFLTQGTPEWETRVFCLCWFFAGSLVLSQQKILQVRCIDHKMSIKDAFWLFIVQYQSWITWITSFSLIQCSLYQYILLTSIQVNYTTFLVYCTNPGLLISKQVPRYPLFIVSILDYWYPSKLHLIHCLLY